VRVGGKVPMVVYDHTRNKSSLLDHRKALRHHSTVCECLLWRKLKGRQLHGYKFRRQYSLENCIFDFYCPQLKLAIELDGAPHFFKEKYIQDRKRDAYFLSNYNISTLRYENWQILSEIDIVINDIYKHIQLIECTSPPSASGLSPSPM